MSTAAAILASTHGGTIQYLAGRPGSGVTTTLIEIANLALADGRPVLLLTAEASPKRLREHRGLSPEVEARDVTGVDDQGLASLIDEHAVTGGVVCIDHLGLIRPAIESAPLSDSARRLTVTMIVGVPLDRDRPPMLQGRRLDAPDPTN
jgi:predicted ATP-dependent serine protease